MLFFVVHDILNVLDIYFDLWFPSITKLRPAKTDNKTVNCKIWFDFIQPYKRVTTELYIIYI